MTDSATFTNFSEDDEDTSGLDDLLASVRADETPKPKRGRPKRGAAAEPEPIFQIGQKLTLSQLESFLWKSADILRGSMYAQECREQGFIGAGFDINEDLTNSLPEDWENSTSILFRSIWR